MTRRLDGKPVAERLIEDCRSRIRAGTAGGRRPPQLVSVHQAAQTPFSFYLRRQEKAAQEVGVGFREHTLPAGSTAVDVQRQLAGLDADAGVDAVLLEHPLPQELDFLSAVATLRPEKDVDGVGPRSLGLLVSGIPIHAPAVALGAVAIARHHGVPLSGRRVAVVGRSPTVGIPLALLLLARGEGADATVTVAHSATRDLASALSGSEVIFSCVGHPGLLDRTTVPEGAVVIDIGLSTVPDPARPNGVRTLGDADAASLDGWASALTPVPGGVGPVTVAQLMHNTVEGWERLVAAKP